MMHLCLHRIVLPLADFALEVEMTTLTGRVTALCGPSGAGKTSLLDLIAGLRRPKSALIQLDGRVLTDTSAGTFVPARHRRIGYVPQDLALFPHLTVRGNLLYGQKRGDKSEDNGLFSFVHVVETLEIAHLEHRSVLNLSGGEKQRVALARALLTSPRLLLLDEPLANLDRGLKGRILPYLVRVRDEFRLPMLYVTHDLAEVRPLCDQVVLMERGRIVSADPGAKS